MLPGLYSIAIEYLFFLYTLPSFSGVQQSASLIHGHKKLKQSPFLHFMTLYSKGIRIEGVFLSGNILDMLYPID